jgi:predicted nucleic acid-binding protein
MASLPAAPLVSTWPCFTEAMYLLDRYVGYSGQAALWSWIVADRLVLYDLNRSAQLRMVGLMQKYHSRPMDLADASLIVAAEDLNLRTIFTLDSDFLFYTLADGSTLTVVP